MIDGRGSRILPILAAILLLVALAVTLTIIFLRAPDNRRFDESILSAEFALNDGTKSALKRELLKASRHAISAANWKDILRISASAIPEEPSASDFKLFTALAGRASSSVPGNQDFLAYWAWGMLRSDSTTKAKRHIESLSLNDWPSLRSEIKLKATIGDSTEDLQSFLGKIEERPDPEFLAQAAMLTESAELTFDAALLYMLNGKPEKAYELAGILMREDNEREWLNDETFTRRAVATALAGMAHDAGEKDEAIRWLSLRIDDSNRRRTASWESLQFLGDLYWEQFLLQGNQNYRKKASESWKSATDLITVAEDPSQLPEDSWRLWINLSVLQQSEGNVRLAEETLNQALFLFPEQNEVKAAWARNLADVEPALARRLVRTSMAESDDSVLGIAAMQVNPEAVTPRLYEARLWELFESVTSGGDKLQSVDSRILTTFLLDYMTSRKNMQSIDVAIDRYLKTYPDEKWILSWRMAADASRGLAMINLLASAPGEPTPYEEFRSLTRSENSWRGLHDSALFAMQASDELNDVANLINGPASDTSAELLDAVLLINLEAMISQNNISGTPMEDRIRQLLKNREDLSSSIKQLQSSGRRAETALSKAGNSIEMYAAQLLINSLEDLALAQKSADHLTAEDQSALVYLEALVLKKSGRREESLRRAQTAIDIDPDNSRARELLLKEVSL